MIRLYIQNDCRKCEEAEERFTDLVLAHKVVNLDEEEVNNVNREDLPVVIDEGKVIKGSYQLDKYFESMEKFLEEWNRFQSDVCYVDDNGEVICTE